MGVGTGVHSINVLTNVFVAAVTEYSGTVPFSTQTVPAVNVSADNTICEPPHAV